MSRHRWARVIWPFDIRTLAKKLEAMPYGELSSSGFILDGARSDYLSGRYVERVEITNVVVDPLGREQSYDRVEFNSTKFIAGIGDYGIELIDPAKSVTGLLDLLSEACGDKLTISTISINPLEWAKAVLSSLSVDGRISSIQCAQIDLEGDAQAKAVISGKDDVISGAMRLLGDRRYIVEKIKIDLKGRRSGNVILGSAAAASISGEDQNRIAEHVRHSLKAVMSRSAV